MHTVLLALGGVSRRIRTGNTTTEKQVIIATVLIQERALDAVVQTSVVRDLVRRVGPDLQRAFERNLVNILPVGAELEVLRAADCDPVGIDAVIVAVGRDADDAVVGPGAGLHCCGGCYADLGGLSAEFGEDVVHVVFSVLVVYVGGLDRAVSVLGIFLVRGVLGGFRYI